MEAQKQQVERLIISLVSMQKLCNAQHVVIGCAAYGSVMFSSLNIWNLFFNIPKAFLFLFVQPSFSRSNLFYDADPTFLYCTFQEPRSNCIYQVS